MGSACRGDCCVPSVPTYSYVLPGLGRESCDTCLRWSGCQSPAGTPARPGGQVARWSGRRTGPPPTAHSWAAWADFMPQAMSMKGRDLGPPHLQCLPPPPASVCPWREEHGRRPVAQPLTLGPPVPRESLTPGASGWGLLRGEGGWRGTRAWDPFCTTESPCLPPRVVGRGRTPPPQPTVGPCRKPQGPQTRRPRLLLFVNQDTFIFFTFHKT